MTKPVIVTDAMNDTWPAIISAHAPETETLVLPEVGDGAGIA